MREAQGQEIFLKLNLLDTNCLGAIDDLCAWLAVLISSYAKPKLNGAAGALEFGEPIAAWQRGLLGDRLSENGRDSKATDEHCKKRETLAVHVESGWESIVALVRLASYCEADAVAAQEFADHPLGMGRIEPEFNRFCVQ